jgi:hypothetical protein
MLAGSLFIFSLFTAFWLTYMIRYPARWAAHVERHRHILSAIGLRLDWMHQIEKGPAMRVLVGLLTLLMLACVSILVHSPDALLNFWRGTTAQQ